MRRGWIATAAVAAVALVALGADRAPGAACSAASPVRLAAAGPMLRTLDSPQVAQGKFLIARRDLPDPNFAETVVLLIRHDERGAMGLIVNRPTEASLATMLPGLDNAAVRRASIFSGGPVSRSTVSLLLRSDEEPRESRRVFADVWVSQSRVVLEELPEDVDAAATLRVYTGYAGWAPGQLEAEVERGDWHVTDADPGIVFHASPRTLWRKLSPRAPDELARATPAPDQNMKVRPADRLLVSISSSLPISYSNRAAPGPG